MPNMAKFTMSGTPPPKSCQAPKRAGIYMIHNKGKN